MRLMRLLISAVVLIGASSACGPVFRTNYTFIPPKSANAKICILQCENAKLQCERIEDLERSNCLDRADRDYYRCQDRNAGRSNDDKVSCYRSYCLAADYERCERNYRACYQTCGGTVTSETVCVSNCEENQ